MDILLKNAGKKYFKEWIFRHLNFQFSFGKSYAVTGPNGSGKSTLLKVISGNIPATEGTITYLNSGTEINPDLWPRQLSFAAPYLEVVEEFTLRELLEFHFSFKKKRFEKENIEFLAEQMYLQDALNKQLKNFSSGMKQRLKLGLAFFTDTPVILLDEPTANLDKKGIDWYLDQAVKIKDTRLLLICSNLEHEYQFCDFTLDITQFKK